MMLEKIIKNAMTLGPFYSVKSFDFIYYKKLKPTTRNKVQSRHFSSKMKFI